MNKIIVNKHKNKVNYQKEMEKIIDTFEESEGVKKLALHVCCAPCSSHCLSVLTEHFDITCVYYNPNISPVEEYEKRFGELIKYVEKMPKINTVNTFKGEYENEKFEAMAKGLEEVPEGGARCHKCYRMRMEYAAEYAKKNGFDYFTTTLSLSPLKDSQIINQIGKEVAEEYGVNYLYSDFKKNNGYLHSIELSKEYDLYRQNFCGCIYSKPDEEKTACN
ncbi:MAG: epoxyqueuosine reductase QueH [Lachnospiraceae bacterium]|nr:epoxyqueuosine reductase QueH [Lachnospiraceae bacterium]